MVARFSGLMLLVLTLGGCAALNHFTKGGKDSDKKDQKWPVVWLDKDHDCQETRTEVLIKEHKGLLQWADPMACHIAQGEWASWGRDVDVNAQSVWVVPLVTPANAVKHGAADWSRKKKIQFINDEENLIILDPTSAVERRGYGPEKWVPLKKYWCQYATRWEDVKHRYGLTIGKDEQAALNRMKQSCPADKSGAGEKTPAAGK